MQHVTFKILISFANLNELEKLADRIDQIQKNHPDWQIEVDFRCLDSSTDPAEDQHGY